MERCERTGVVAASPERVFDAWVDGDAHAAMTGGAATSDPRVGGRFTAWDGYITGAHAVLERPRRIVQRWRTSRFPADAPDSTLEVLLRPVAEGTEITLRHGDIPDGQGAAYAQGWVDHYLAPMRAHFAG